MVQPRKLTTERVLEARRQIAAREFSMTHLARTLGVAHSSLADAVHGRTFQELPGALPFPLPRPERLMRKRRFADEVVLFMRLNAAIGVSVHTLCAAHGASESAIQHLLTGSTYSDVPGALPSRQGIGRKLTSEQAERARRLYATRYVSTLTLAREYGVHETVMNSLLRGRSYKDVGHAVPEHVVFIEHRRKRVFKMKRQVRYPSASIRADNDHRSSSPNPDHPSEADSQISG
jgi:hypothetical protein